MKIDDEIRDEKLQHNINRGAAKTSAYAYEYLTGEEIPPPDQRKLIEQDRFTYSPLGKALEKQTKTIENQGKKQAKAVEYRGKQLVESNELIKQDFDIKKDSIPLEEQKKLMNLLKKNILNLRV